MSVCQSYNCDNKARPGEKYCARCWEELQAMAKRHPKQINWWAVFVAFGVIAAYGVLHAVGRI